MTCPAGTFSSVRRSVRRPRTRRASSAARAAASVVAGHLGQVDRRRPGRQPERHGVVGTEKGPRRRVLAHHGAGRIVGRRPPGCARPTPACLAASRAAFSVDPTRFGHPDPGPGSRGSGEGRRARRRRAAQPARRSARRAAAATPSAAASLPDSGRSRSGLIGSGPARRPGSPPAAGRGGASGGDGDGRRRYRRTGRSGREAEQGPDGSRSGADRSRPTPGPGSGMGSGAGSRVAVSARAAAKDRASG